MNRRLVIGAAIVLAASSIAHSREGARTRDADRTKDAQKRRLEPLAEARSIDGTGNNQQNPEWGAADTPFPRATFAAYEDGRSEPSGATRPSARAVSNAVFAAAEPRTNAAGVSDMFWQWGQFLDHDIDLTPTADPAEAFDIIVPTGDPWFDPNDTGAVTIGLDRSSYTAVDSVREQMNGITSFIDASQVYGSDEERANALRTLDGTGRLKTTEGRLLPFNDAGFDNAPTGADPSYFLAGDVRANEQIGLTALHTLFVREHNHWASVCRRKLRRRAAAKVQLTRPDGEEIYQMARALVGAEMQAITYREFLPRLLGPDALAPYTGYDPSVDPSITNEFATAAYRFGHSMLPTELLRLDKRGREIDAGNISLASAFFAPDETTEHGIEPVLRGLVSQRAQEIDAEVVDDIRNFLFGPPGAGGFDLASLNIQRGRDHGLPSYNDARVDLGLPRATAFADISSDSDVQRRLQSVYDNVDDIDLWVGGLAEDHKDGAMVGETYWLILKRQFEALRDGDRLWYERTLSRDEIRRVERRTLAKIMRRNARIGRQVGRDAFVPRDR